MDHPPIMTCRYKMLQEALSGYQQFHVPFVTSNNTFAGFSDDKGIYFLIPKLAQLLHLSLDQSITIFYMSIIGIAFVLSLIGALLFFQSWLGRISFIMCSFILAMISYIYIYDVYLVSTAITIATIPWLLYFVYRNNHTKHFVIFLVLCGILAGFSQYIRSFSSIPIILFTLILIVTCKNLNLKAKTLLTSSLMLGFLLPVLYFNYLFWESSNYLKIHNPHGNLAELASSHPKWHSIYLGLGYVSNPYGITSSDTTSKNKAESVEKNVAYLSKRYEAILKNETIKFIELHPDYFIALTKKKIYDSFKNLSLFAFKGENIPWLDAFTKLIYKTLLPGSFILLFSVVFLRRYLWLHAAFLASIIISLIPVILVIPFFKYLGEFLSLTYLYVFVFISLTIDKLIFELKKINFTDTLKMSRFLLLKKGEIKAGHSQDRSFST